MKDVEFLFDFGSPYTYLGYHGLLRLARSTAVNIVWTPMLLGGVFQATGNHSPAEIPAKGRWMNLDLARWASRLGVTFQHNPHFPINTLTLMRGAVGYQMKGDRLHEYVATIFDAMWRAPRNLNDAATLAAVLEQNGFDPGAFMAMVSDPEVKERLKQNTAQAVARGVFGAPTYFVDGQMHWGADRLLFVEEALAG